MGRIIKLFLILTTASMLSACHLKDWIRKDDSEYVSVDEFKRITRTINNHGRTEQVSADEYIPPKQITQLFVLLANYNASTDKERRVLYKKVHLTFKQNPTLFSALFLSMIEVTNTKNNAKLTVNSNLMKAVDFSEADPDLLELYKVLNVFKAERIEKSKLKDKVKRYQVENSKHKKEVIELTAQINALKKIEESIYARELVLDVQE